MNRNRNAITRILVYSSDPGNQSLVQTYLEKQPRSKFKLIKACHTSEIEDALNRETVDLVLMSIDMADESNIYRIRQIIEKHLVPVIVLTENGNEETAVQLLKQGAIDYLPNSSLSSTRLIEAINQGIRKWKATQRSKALQEDLERQVNIDSLTGLLNRRMILKSLKESMKRARRYEEKLCVLFLDIDNFKQINDLYGHNAGDSTLQKVSLQLQKKLRDTDIAGRYGGDEFLIILPHTDLACAKFPAERIRKAVEVLRMKNTKGKTYRLTVSVGIVEYKPGDDITSFIDRADNVLYAAKKNGRNRVLSRRK